MKTKEQITEEDLRVMNNIPFAGTVTLSYRNVSNVKIKSSKIDVIIKRYDCSIKIKFYKFIYEIDLAMKTLYIWYNEDIIITKNNAKVYLCYNKKGNVDRIELM